MRAVGQKKVPGEYKHLEDDGERRAHEGAKRGDFGRSEEVQQNGEKLSCDPRALR